MAHYIYYIVYKILKGFIYMYITIHKLYSILSGKYNSIQYYGIYNKNYIVVYYIYFILRYANPTLTPIKIHKNTNRLLYIWQRKSNLLYQIHSAK